MTQAEQFTQRLLQRHDGNTEAALEECRELRDMSEFGHAFFNTVEYSLYVRLATERDHG